MICSKGPRLLTEYRLKQLARAEQGYTIYVTLHRKISHNAGEEFLELARAGQSTFNQLSFGTEICFIPGSVPELRHFEVTEVKKSTMEKRSKTLIIAWVGVN